ncbi:hypothetical protein DRO59_08570 [Candidatus Bathyarchaeota archaeon]|nr:MAG: hypothetical protein DRO59_08570 [Candidatus Bathyarchaeota archaeon]
MKTALLFKVTVKGLAGKYKSAYVISDSPDDAYRTYRSYLDKEDLGFKHVGDRELEKVELIAKFYREAEINTPMLFISDSVTTPHD